MKPPIIETGMVRDDQWPLHNKDGWVLDAFDPLPKGRKQFTYFHAGDRHRLIVSRPIDWVRE